MPKTDASDAPGGALRVVGAGFALGMGVGVGLCLSWAAASSLDAPEAPRTSAGEQSRVGWAPCSPITYQVLDPPAGAETIVDSAVRRVQALTGLRYHKLPPGAIDDGPAASGADAAVTIRFEDPQWTANSLLADETAGITSNQYDYRTTTPQGPARPQPARDQTSLQITASDIVLETGYFIGADPAVAEHLVLHELGHSLGLPHSTDPASLMYLTLTGRPLQLTANDEDALRRAGEHPC